MSGDVTAMDINCALASRYRRDGDGYWTEISVTEPNDTVLRLDGVALEVNWRGDTWISGYPLQGVWGGVNRSRRRNRNE